MVSALLLPAAASSSFCATRASLFPTRAAADDVAQYLSATGVVTSISHQGQHAWLVLSAPDAVIGITDQNGALNDFRFGDTLVVKGTVCGKYDEFCKATVSDIVRTGQTNDVPTQLVSGMRISNGSTFGQCVSCQGIVSSACTDAGASNAGAVWNWVILRTDEGPVHAICPNDAYPIEDLRCLTGAFVGFKGISLKMTESGNPAAAFLQLFSSGGVTVIAPPPSDPFAISGPNHPITSRRCVSGFVLAVSANGILISGKPTNWQTLLLPGQAQPRPGQRVTVVGYLNPFARNTILSDALLRIDDTNVATPPPVRKVSARELFDGDSVNFDVRQVPVMITGKLPEAPVRIGGETIVRLACAGRTIDVDITHWQDTLRAHLEPGCTVEISGYILPIYGNGIEHPLASVEKLLFLLRTADDIVIISRPPWWTPGRLMALLGIFAAALFGVIGWNVSLNRRARAKGKELAAEQLAHVTSELKVNERTRLAVELHDALSQTLTGVSMQIDTAAGFAEGKMPAITKCLNLASRTIDACRMELRNTLWDLRSAALDESSMDAAIRKTLCQNLAGIDLSVRFNVPRESFSDNTAHAVLKIVRELATNAIRHGKATSLKIAGTVDDGKLLFSVRDNGCGFDPDLAPGISQGHFGLQGITERLERLNGEMKIDSAPGKGAKVTIVLPIPRSGE